MLATHEAKAQPSHLVIRRKRSKTITLHLPNGASPQSDREALALDYLHERTLYSSEFQRGFWISINASLWEQLLGGNYAKTLAALRLRGRIEINPRYSTGRFPKSYRLCEAFLKCHTEPYELLRNRKLRSSVRIDAEDQVGHAMAEMFHSIQFSTESGISGWDRQIVHRIRRGRFYASRCEYGRFHSSFTGLSREARSRLIAVDGDPLVEIDVSCCQPLLVGVMAADFSRSGVLHADTSGLCLSSVPVSGLTAVPVGQCQRSNNTPPPHPYSICPALSANIEEYLSLCQAGQLYDLLTELCAGKTLFDFIPPDNRHQYSTDREIRRDDVKRAFLVMLFCKVPMMQRLPLFQIVKDFFPEVAAYLVHAKRNEYQDLARDCQRMESQLMIDGAAAELIRRHPDAIFVTIHDAILVQQRYLNAAADCIREQFARWGVQPHLKGVGSVTSEAQQPA